MGIVSINFHSLLDAVNLSMRCVLMHDNVTYYIDFLNEIDGGKKFNVCRCNFFS